MRSRRAWLSLALGPLAVLVACGGLKEATDDVPAPEPTNDAATAPSGDDGGGASDATADVGSDAGVSPPRPDAGPLVFVTSAQVKGDFAVGKTDPWAAADEICATEAKANSLAGTFVAWLSFEKSGTAFNAATRIADTAYSLPGSVADGGAPVLVVASRSELLTTGPRVDMDRLANGDRVPQDENANVAWTWTGTTGTGTAASMHCKAWTTALDTEPGVTGNARRIPMPTPTDWTSLGGRPCNVARRFYCFQK